MWRLICSSVFITITDRSFIEVKRTFHQRSYMTGLHWPHAWGKHFNTPVPLTTAPLSSQSHSFQEKRQNLMEKLLPRSCLLSPGVDAALLVEEKGKEKSFTNVQGPVYKSTMAENGAFDCLKCDTAKERVVDTVDEALHSSAEEHTTPASVSTALGGPADGERLFVFRDAHESPDSVDVFKRKRKRNFLNLKKGSVAPTNLPWVSTHCCARFYTCVYTNTNM